MLTRFIIVPTLFANIERFSDPDGAVDLAKGLQLLYIDADSSFSHIVLEDTSFLLNSQSPLYFKNNPRRSNSEVNSQLTMNNFGTALKKKLEEKGMRAAELARRSGISKQGVGRLLNDVHHPITNAPPKPERETVIKLAEALDWDLDEALLAADFAPMNSDYEHGLFKGIEKLSPEKQTVVRQATHAMIEALSKEDEPDTNYID